MAKEKVNVAIIGLRFGTHCVSPGLELTPDQAEYVSCFGSGTIREESIPQCKSPFSVETPHIEFRNSDLSAGTLPCHDLDRTFTRKIKDMQFRFMSLPPLVRIPQDRPPGSEIFDNRRGFA